MEAKQATAQAASLLDRLAGAEQDLIFEAARNAERLQAIDEDNVRLRAAAVAAEKRLTVAENVLRRKGREIEELQLKGKQAGLRGKAGSGVGGARRRGARDRGDAATAGLEFRVFAAAADARSAVQRCATAAVERRSAAGSVLADALRVTGSEGAETATARVNSNVGEYVGEGKSEFTLWAITCLNTTRVLVSASAASQGYRRTAMPSCLS